MLEQHEVLRMGEKRAAYGCEPAGSPEPIKLKLLNGTSLFKPRNSIDFALFIEE